MADSEVRYERLIYENEIKNYQLRAVINEFREREYFHIRRYFQNFEGDWVPSKEGVSMELSIKNVYNLLDALVEICANAEGIDSMTQHFADKIADLKNKVE